MKALLTAVALLLLAPMSYANVCLVPRLGSFAVYTVGDMDVRLSDHQGLSGAGGQLRAENFLFEGSRETCLGVVSGQNLTLISGSVGGDLEARSVNLTKMNTNFTKKLGAVRYTVRARVVNSSVRQKRIAQLSVHHASLQAELEGITRDLAEFSPTGAVAAEGGYYVARLHSGTNVIRILAADLELMPRLILEGPADASVIIQLIGDQVILRGLDVIVRRGLEIPRIRWVLPTATYLFISNTANGVYGMPGFIFAPCANTEFYEGLITGGLYVKSIWYSEGHGYHSGQVNRIPPGTGPYCQTCAPIVTKY